MMNLEVIMPQQQKGKIEIEVSWEEILNTEFCWFAEKTGIDFTADSQGVRIRCRGLFRHAHGLLPGPCEFY